MPRPTTPRHPHRLRLARLALVLAAGSLALAACGSGNTARVVPGGGTVEGTWTLVSGTGPQGDLLRVDGYPVSLTVTDGRITGVAACNSYGGDVKRDGDAFVPGALAVTEMACANERVMTLEAGYLAALGGVSTASVKGNTTLTLTGEGVSLVFGRNAPDPDSPLEGRRWVLDTVMDADTASTTFGGGWIALDGNGRLTGNGGCQDLTGSYALQGTRLVATDVTLTAGPLTDCAREAVRQDETVRGILAAGPTAKITGTRLVLTAGTRSLGFVDRGTTT